MQKRYYYLKYLCEQFHIHLTYEDPDTEEGFKEAVKDLEEALVKKGFIRINPENGHIMVRKGGTINERHRNAPRRKSGSDKKILSVHGQVYVTRSVRGA